jgi:hypothetical protein
MNQSCFKREGLNRLGRAPPATLQTTLEWLPDVPANNRGRGSAPARQEGLPPTFTIASPSPIEGEAMVKAGGKEREF